MERITIKGGDVSGGAGGGVLTEGRVFLGETRITGNRADFGAGAAALGSVSRLSLGRSSMRTTGRRRRRALPRRRRRQLARSTGSLIEGNRAPEGGGGIFFLPGDADLHFDSSTITAHQSLGSTSSDGGGLYTESLLAGPGVVAMGQVTIASNEAPTGEGSNIHAEVGLRSRTP